jgi:hypothetical protein
MSQQLTGARFGQIHKQFQLFKMIQLKTLGICKTGRFLAAEQLRDLLPRLSRRLEFRNLARATAGDELSHFLVSSHALIVPLSALAGKQSWTGIRDRARAIIVEGLKEGEAWWAAQSRKSKGAAKA